MSTLVTPFAPTPASPSTPRSHPTLVTRSGKLLTAGRPGEPVHQLVQRAARSRTILRRVDLRGTDLRHTDCRGAMMAEATLAGACCQWTNFAGANLRGADFRDADLRSAHFVGANLTGADFTGAQLGGAVFEAEGWPARLAACTPVAAEILRLAASQRGVPVMAGRPGDTA